MNAGVTIGICCHNSLEKLPRLFESLLSLNVPTTIQCEIIFVDNASTDATSDLIAKFLNLKCTIKIRKIFEPKLGLIYARKLVFREAQYEYVSFLDDDNLPESDWIERVYELFQKWPEAGVLGGLNQVEFKSTASHWFLNYQEKLGTVFSNSFAVGPQAPHDGDITDTRGYVWGAGMSIRKSAWHDIEKLHFLCVGARGRALSRGEDSEICLALILAGWRIYYSATLKLKHCLNPEKMTWKSLKIMRREGGRANARLGLYQHVRWERKYHETIAYEFRKNIIKTMRSVFHLNYRHDFWSLVLASKLGELYEYIFYARKWQVELGSVRQIKGQRI